MKALLKFLQDEEGNVQGNFSLLLWIVTFVAYAASTLSEKISNIISKTTSIFPN